MHIIRLLIYVLAGVALFPILYYVLMYQLGLNINAPDTFAVIRVVISGPMLVFLGILLLILFKTRMNRIFAILLVSIGIVWIFVIAQAVMSESA